ncbi:hypothetical protein JIG36_26975 [Actinoplanes sp. LDG1-06]|uniref:Uncharacterized protein n=1 Tax=Paractinoplanes ovalisporus TaxID=2810368 RepID=A0ABS2AH76_9ACTN|nr:hypothetical protein [Actinoplanes ovalisporus]MBM2619201.1 hypothetical protein [Actinoplanes ovalisporus]
MAFRTWVKLVGAAFGAAALVGAGQLGLAYGLGILSFSRVVEITARDEWTGQLAWVAWFALTAAAAGGVAARPRLPQQAGAGTRLVGGVAAGLGAAMIVPLTMQPARAAEIAGVNAVFVIGACALIGAAAGIFAAYAALGRSAARWSLTTLSSVIWAVALVSVAPSLRSGETLPPVRLGVLDATFVPDGVLDRVALLTMPVIALICGLVLGFTARNRSLSTTAIALAGLPGPALLTAAYLVAGPGTTRAQEMPYWAAMTAAGAGVFGSVLAAVLRRGPATDRPDSPDAAEPTPDRPPLPQRESPRPDSAIAKAGGSLPGTGAAQAVTGRASVAARATVAARAAVAAQRPEHELKPSDTGVITMPPFNGFAPPAPPQRPDGEIADWVSGLGRPQ